MTVAPVAGAPSPRPAHHAERAHCQHASLRSGSLQCPRAICPLRRCRARPGPAYPRHGGIPTWSTVWSTFCGRIADHLCSPPGTHHRLFTARTRGHLTDVGNCYCAVTGSKYDRYTGQSTFVCPLRARPELALSEFRVRGLGCEACRAPHPKRSKAIGSIPPIAIRRAAHLASFDPLGSPENAPGKSTGGM